MQLLPGKKTRMWTFNGSFPGPTIRVPSGRPVEVTYANRLPVAANAMTIHNHGGHQPASEDGQPEEYLIPPGGQRTYRYPLTEEGRPERAAFQWYHDHRMDRTARNLWRGLAGMFILDDGFERGLPLPGGQYDVPLMLVDRSFDSDNQLVDRFPEGGPAGGRAPPSDEVVGDHTLVNGAAQPHFEVADRSYRLRLLNASNFRTYDLSLGDGRSMVQVANESGLLPAPIRRNSVRLGPAERAEVVVDFAGLHGRRIELGSSSGPVMQFRVDRRAAGDPTNVRFDTLRPAPSFGAVPSTPNRTFSFNEGVNERNGRTAWTINGRTFDHHRTDATARLNTTERWRFTNPSSQPHVVHLHSGDFRVLTRNITGDPEPGEEGLKESVLLDPGETVDVAVRFTDHTGKFVLHCHMLEHEDNGMMANIVVVAGSPAALLLGPPGLVALAILLLGLRDRPRRIEVPRRTAIAAGAALAGVAATHAADLPDKLIQAPYLAVLFALTIFSSLALAAVILARRAGPLTWAACGALSLAALAGYAVSRSAGLPDIEDHVGHWLEPAAVAAALYELFLVGLSARVLSRWRAETYARLPRRVAGGSRIMRRTLLGSRPLAALRRAAVLGVLVALGLGAAPAFGQAGEPDGLAADVRSVSAIAPLRSDNGRRALEVYRAVLPRGVELPREPAVGVWLAELSSVRSADGRPFDPASHWIEGAIMLRVRRAGEDGWYPIHYPVTAEFWFQAGRSVGLPKRRASAAIARDGAGWRASAVPSGSGPSESMVLGWQPAGGGDPAALRRAFDIPSDPFFVLNPAMRGPDLMRVEYQLNRPYPFQTLMPGSAPAFDPASPSPQGGSVRLRLRPDIDAAQEPDLPKVFPPGTSLADVVDTDQMVPGTHAFYALTVNSSSKKVGEGGYTAPGPAPASSSPAAGRPDSARRGCRRVRYVSLGVRRLRRSRVRSIRARIGRRRIRARVMRNSRVRLDLRRLRRTRYRVKIVIVGRSGKRYVHRRTVSKCARRR